MQHVVAIMGPTGSGKSAWALEIARKFNGEIVSVDSMQLYRGLEIGTAQPSAQERALVPHHLVGIYDLDRRAEVFDFCRLAEDAVAQIIARGKLPVLCGGTGLYFKALLRGLDDLPGDRTLRAELDRLYDSPQGEPALAERMRELDPAGLERWRNCRRRLLRALEVRLLTGRSITELQQGERPLRYRVTGFVLDPEPETLRCRIAERCRRMLDNGWIDEAKSAIAAGLFSAPTAHQALGYRQIAEYLAGSSDRRLLAEKITTATWQFARRQRTWFRHQHPECRRTAAPVELLAADVAG